MFGFVLCFMNTIYDYIIHLYGKKTSRAGEKHGFKYRDMAEIRESGKSAIIYKEKRRESEKSKNLQ